MIYLVTHPNYAPFLTNWFDSENHFTEDMVVYNLLNNTYTTNGIEWIELNIDNL